MLIFFKLFFYLLYLFMIISYNTLLPFDKPVAVDIGIVFDPIPVRDKVIEFDVVAMTTNVSNDLSNVVIVLYFLLFLDLFLSLKYVINYLTLLIWLLKLLTSFILFLIAVLNQSIFSNGADGYNLLLFWSIYMPWNRKIAQVQAFSGVIGVYYFR